MKKILIKGKLTVKTGLHIGGDSSFSAIGSIDSVVVKNPSSGRPIIPGSSLKGKIRSLLAKNEHHENIDFSEEKIELRRLFGSDNLRARLIFSDANVLTEQDNYTEAKWENTIRRRDGVANPRQIERVIPDVEFEFNLTYNLIDEKEAKDDFLMLANGLKLLQADYLGGGGTRGNGRVVFTNFEVESLKEYNLDHLNQLLKEVEEFGRKLYSWKA